MPFISCLLAKDYQVVFCPIVGQEIDGPWGQTAGVCSETLRQKEQDNGGEEAGLCPVKR